MDLMDFGVRNLPPTLFTHNHVPLWKPEWGTRYRTLPVTFPTDKSPAGEVFARLPLMADGLVHLDTDPDVTAIAPYPMKIEYFAPTRNNMAVKREHLPDVAVRRVDGSVVFIDYVPVNEQAEKPWIARRTRILEDHIAAHYGCAYAVHDELCLLAHPLFPNLKAMWAHKATPLDPPEVWLVTEALRRCHFPSRIGVLKSALHADEELREVFSALDVDGADTVYTAIMQMCISGELDIDLSMPFAATTSVTARSLRGA
ncbi:hypothetical protein DEM27_32720 [Metarhizobium album]|uniref:TnsA endonuclease N-terminal domain-containing protein n=1 Tax=Metarhizobium album TaxID=2182425 RepID=A0A2U2DFN2_9HYPH|nr:hypothetical protein [Rhizobium album]PWE52127.1 hypothetical protein DEM27_32720 [Rhizobium album]